MICPNPQPTKTYKTLMFDKGRNPVKCEETIKIPCLLSAFSLNLKQLASGQPLRCSLVEHMQQCSLYIYITHYLQYIITTLNTTEHTCTITQYLTVKYSTGLIFVNDV